MTTLSAALWLLLSITVNGVFCAGVAALATPTRDDWILLLVLTGGCALLFGLSASLLEPSAIAQHWDCSPNAHSASFPDRSRSGFVLADRRIGPLVARLPFPAFGFWLCPVLFLGTSVLLYFLLQNDSVSPDFYPTAGYLAMFLFILGTALPTGTIVLQRWQLSKQQPCKNREGLLQAVKREVSARSRQSLHYAVREYLAREESPGEMPRIWEVEVKIGKHPKQSVEKEERILQVLERRAKAPGGVEALNAVGARVDTEAQTLRVARIGGIVLILGAAGAGKTSTLLELAEDLCDRAVGDETAPMPVVLDLKSWRSDRHFSSWLVREVSWKYGASRVLVRKWVASDRLLPLLDGLDEIPEDRQEQCLETISRARGQDGRSLPLVLCSRMDTYQRRKSRLHLYAAIGLQPLTVSQVEEYLRSSRSRELWEDLQSNPGLLKLAKTPLLLNLMTLAYEEILIHSWKRLTSREERIVYLFNAYIRRQLTRDLPSRAYGRRGQPPNAEHTRYWLRWLATTMTRANLTAFSISELPPIRLPAKGKDLIYPVGIVVSYFLVYSVVFAAIYGGEAWKIYGIFFGIIALSAAGLVALKVPDVNLTTVSHERLWRSAVGSLLFALLGLLGFQAIGALISHIYAQEGWVMYGLSVLFFIAAVLPIFGAIAGAIVGIPWMQHLTVRLILWRDGETPWDYTKFLNYAAERLFLQRVGGRYRFLHDMLRDRLSE
ncbi:NACHT domain-containing protein [Phormidium sp. CCY1219]|uniref:NACHT domain-containing protein n=1 Tax=Phormidium sp. CCY1219 TaxID=2886104 RepID=UPI002D1F1806|nr:NACHT domain-containing protein [Phormidium sp. CCY1219]MEB3829274.1 NACHT domain-containing protein [Phormidium sp. CCY1219]